MLGIGKQIALCHIFSEIVNYSDNSPEGKWELFKKYWEATQGEASLLPIIQTVFHAESIYMSPVKFTATKGQDLDWSNLWTLVDLVGNVVEDYARSSVIKGVGTPQLIWLQSPKKRVGTFFTPSSLARFIAGKIREIWDHPWIETRILDPSVGCGHFLLALAEVYAKRVKSLDHVEFERFIKCNLFGVDQDLAAVTATALLLGAAGGDWHVVDAVRKNLFQADALQMDVRDQYHIVIGNPPWGCVRGAERKRYAQKYPMCNDFENFEYFSVRGLDATTPGGLHAFVVPNTFFRNILSSKFREWYASRAQFVEIHDFSNVPVFAEPKVRCSVFIARKTRTLTTPSTILIHSGKALNEAIATYSLSPRWFRANVDTWHLSHFPPELVEGIYTPILSRSQPLGRYTESKQGFIPYRFTTLAARLTERLRDFATKNTHAKNPIGEVLEGIWPSCIPPPSLPLPTQATYDEIGHDLAQRIVKERPWHKKLIKDTPIPAGYIPLLKGRDVRSFCINWRGTIFAYGPHVSSYVEERFFTLPRLLFPEITGILPHLVQAAYTRDTYIHDPQVINAVFKNEFDTRWHWFCLAAVNSLPVSAFMVISSPKIGKGLFQKLLVQDIKRVPIPLDPSILRDLDLDLEKMKEIQDIAPLDAIICGIDLTPLNAVECGIRLGLELTRLRSREKMDQQDENNLQILRHLNDILFCRLFNVDPALCLEAVAKNQN